MKKCFKKNEVFGCFKKVRAEYFWNSLVEVGGWMAGLLEESWLLWFFVRWLFIGFVEMDVASKISEWFSMITKSTSEWQWSSKSRTEHDTLNVKYALQVSMMFQKNMWMFASVRLSPRAAFSQSLGCGCLAQAWEMFPEGSHQITSSHLFFTPKRHRPAQPFDPQVKANLTASNSKFWPLSGVFSFQTSLERFQSP